MPSRYHLIQLPLLLMLTEVATARIDYEPSVAPDGQHIAFISDRDGSLRLHAMNRDETDVRRLSDSPGEDDAPAWSPDGTRIAFTSLVGKESRVFVINADGTQRRQLTTDGSGAHLHPNWSPDGRRILFNRFADGSFRTSEVDLATLQVRDVSQIQGSFASWSPDGSTILLRAQFGDNSDIALISPAGDIVSRITRDPGFDGWPSFSPDGSRIVFAREVADGVRSDIFIVPTQGGPETRITSGPGRKTTPRWADGGRVIVFAQSGQGTARIVRVPVPVAQNSD